jgi:hypothetical protein
VRSRAAGRWSWSACRALCPDLAPDAAPGDVVAHLMEPPSIDAGEITDKGCIN